MIKVMLHTILLGNTGGPNVSMKNIASSSLNNKYQFSWLHQRKKANGLNDKELLNDMIEQIDLEKPDIVHISGLQIAGFYAVKACVHSKTKPTIILTVRGSSTEALKFNFIKKIIMKYVVEKYTLRKSNYVYTVCHNPQSLDLVKKYSKNYIGCIYNFPPTILNMKNNIDRKSLDVDQSTLLISVCSRMVYDKGISFILEIIRNTPNYIKFIFIGDGPYVQYINDKFKDELESKKIILIGKTSNSIEYISLSDIFLFPSLHENLPNVLLEACSLGKPIIATDVGGNCEIVENNFNGVLIEPFNEKAIFKAINFFDTNRDKIKEFGENSKLVIANKFNHTIIEKEIDDLYCRCIHEKEKCI